jgi:hypothetical protein
MRAADVLIESLIDWALPFCRPWWIHWSLRCPPKGTADQVLKFAESSIRGEPNRTQIALTALSDKVREMV